VVTKTSLYRSEMSDLKVELILTREVSVSKIISPRPPWWKRLLSRRNKSVILHMKTDIMGYSGWSASPDMSIIFNHNGKRMVFSAMHLETYVREWE